MATRERNRVLVGLVAVLILAGAVYGPVALLAPLPAATATATTPEGGGSDSPAPALPTTGSSAVTLGSDATPIMAGSTTPVPMAAATKLVTALVVLDAFPVPASDSGPTIVATNEDFLSFVNYQAEGVRAVRVLAGDQWSEREALQAMVVASSNNHAEMLARWAFGSTDAYLTAASAWLERNGLTGISVADTTGLDPASVGTGGDLARLAALVRADPLLAELTESPRDTSLHGSPVENTIGYRASSGVKTLSRSYTDEAGVCVVFAYPVDVGGTAVTVYGALLGEPSYDQLDADLDALLAGLPGAITAQDAVPAGSVWGRYTTEWGDSVDAVAAEPLSVVDWAGTAVQGAEVTLDPLTTARPGLRVGTLSVPTRDGDQQVALVLDGRLSDPGPLWRLTNPGVVVPAFIGMVSGG
ncbi:MAG: hypothetical protein ABWZ77_05315 [Naasia sp.]